MQMTEADIQDAVATAMIGSAVNSADAWTTLYVAPKVPAKPKPYPKGWDTMPTAWDDSTHDPRMITLS